MQEAIFWANAAHLTLRAIHTQEYGTLRLLNTQCPMQLSWYAEHN